jgi:hypothetical protein
MGKLSVLVRKEWQSIIVHFDDTTSGAEGQMIWFRKE